ncbi:MAG: omptin family outer membrane protease, partial [Treponema sp.]|nr:omptin family outer membrane protease [Treponema sp.]
KASHSFSLSVETGFLYGVSREIVYGGSLASNYLSEIQWNIRPLWFAGAAVEYAPKFGKNGFFGTFEIKAGIPGKTGVIEDRDWLSPVTIPGALTHFSSHDNFTRTAVLADIGGGIAVPLTASLVLRLSFDFSYMYYKYEAHNGYTQYHTNSSYPPYTPYKPWAPGWPKVPMNGLGMDYAQHWFIPRPGAKLVLRQGRFSLSASASISPFVFCFTVDNHYRRNPPFLVESELSGGFFIEPKGSVSFELNDRCEIGLTLAYRYIGETRGDAAYHEYESFGTVITRYANIAGAAYRAFEAALMFSYTP